MDAGLERGAAVEAESAPDEISLVWSHVLGRGNLPLRPELSFLYGGHTTALTRRLHLLLSQCVTLAGLGYRSVTVSVVAGVGGTDRFFVSSV